MGEILQSWIQARLGVMIDLTPEIFGHYTRDGKLLAQMLHSYDIITRDQLDTIVATDDPALCRVNLKLLGLWLRFLGVDCDDGSITEISCGKGTSSLRLFYKIYLSLETKDRLHFITLQKEREKFVPASKKFEVSVVCEDPPPYQPAEHPLSRKLARGGEAIRWHRACFPPMLRGLKREKERLRSWKPYPFMRTVDRCIPETPAVKIDQRREDSKELDQFARKHRAKSLEGRGEGYEAKGCVAVEEDPELARDYVDRLKRRKKRWAVETALKSEMQKALLSELWEKMAERQERDVDEAIAGRVLDQSRYEKQIVTKLCEVRDQRNVMAENQRVVEDLTMEANAVEHLMRRESEKDLASIEFKDVETECLRMCELRRRIREEKIRKLKEKHRNVCLEIVEDMVSVALKIAESRAANEGQVPLSMLSEWKALFLRCQPIFDEDIFCLFDVAPPDGEGEESLLEEVSRIKLEKIRLLRDALFEDYRDENSPWDEFLPALADDERERFELGRTVLGYIVHRLLNSIYPPPMDRSQLLLPSSKNVAIVVGVSNSNAHRTMRALLSKAGVALVRMEDAINYCLERYKSETKDLEYIDLNIVAATEDIVAELQSDRRRKFTCPRTKSSGKRSKKSEERLSRRTESSSEAATTAKGRRDRGTKKSDGSARGKTERGPKTVEKHTQTPRNIPFDDMDPVLTDSAYIGKWTYEFLVLGEPISDDLTTKILIEYLKSLKDAKGWALIDYPNTYDQMSRLETALTGYRLPPDPKVLDFEEVSIEDVEYRTPRVVLEEDEDPSELNRVSRLVPNPFGEQIDRDSGSTFVTLFVRVAQKPKNFEARDRSFETPKEDTPSMDRFYASQRIARVLYYSSLDLTALKRLARLVIGEPVRRIPSEELFGEVLGQLEGDDGRSVGSKAPVVRRLVSEVEADDDDDDAAERGEEEEADSFYDLQAMEAELRTPRPGDDRWEWVDCPLPPSLLRALANLWEGLERTYIVGLKDALFLKSVHSGGILLYKNTVTRNAREYIRRPDKKQDLLHEFHKAYNAIDQDARNDVDVKCELHRRVADFQATLWEICDRRRTEAEEERKRYIADHWTAFEQTILFNVYVAIIQAEVDRCIDTVRLIQDYYLGMLNKPLQDLRFSKVLLNRLEVGGVDPIFFREPSVELSRSARRERSSRRKAGSPRAPPAPPAPPAAVDYLVLRKEVSDWLLDRSKQFRDPEESSAFKAVLENVRYAKLIVDGLSTVALDLIKKEDAAASKSKASATDPTDPLALKLASRGRDLVSEWRYALSYEVDRIRTKLESIAGAARTDVAFLLETMQRTFHQIYDSILDRYWREMRSANEMANIFCFAIEEGRPLENEMLLDDDRFVVRSNVFLMQTSAARPPPPVTAKETDSPSRFRISQLAKLMEIFRRISPHGVLSERALVHVLQDLAAHGGLDEGEPTSLPCSWYRLRARDISSLVDRLFESEACVDWREFIVHALDLPAPSHREILIARDRFRIQDPLLKEVVTRARYHRTPLWFLDCSDTSTEAVALLRDEYQRNCEQLFEEEVHDLVLEAETTNGSVQARRSSVASFEPCHASSEETLRLILAKELLRRMYTIGRDAVNYTALLLAFCKDEDPREGFGKALTLALGNRVCTDVEEGERYAEGVLEQRRDAAVEVTDAIVRRLLRKVYDAVDPTGESVSSLDSVLVEGFASAEADSREEMERGKVSLYSSPMEAESVPSADQEYVVYWLSFDVCLTVLAAALPWHVSQPEIMGTSRNLRDNLALAYEELRDGELTDDPSVVLAHRLVNHDFMQLLLHGTGKFRVRRIGGMVEDLLRERESGKVG